MKPALNLISILMRQRVLFCLVSFFILIAPPSLVWLDWPNRFLYQIGVQLSSETEQNNDVVNIAVPVKELEHLVRDASGAVRLGQLLQGLKGVYTKGVVLLLDEVPHDENYIHALLKKRSGTFDAELQAAIERQSRLESLIKEGSIMIGVSENGVMGADEKRTYLRERLRVKQIESDDPVSPLEFILAYDTGPSLLGEFPLADFRFESGLGALAYYEGKNVAYPLLWRVKEDLFPDSLLELYRAVNKSKAIAYSDKQVILDNKDILSSRGAVFYPFYSQGSSVTAPIDTLAIKDVLSTQDFKRFQNKVVFIGAKGSQSLSYVPSVFYSLHNDAYYSVPKIYMLIEKLGFLLIFALVLFVLPRLRPKIAIIVAGFTLLSLLIVTWGMQISQKQWLPMGLLVSYLLFGYCLMLWNKFAAAWMGEWELAVVAKGKSLPRVNTQVVPAPRKQADATIVETPQAKSKSKIGQMFDRTVAVTRPGKKLKMGRYEVDDELGRGAMGVVYLGHDPLIDRKVAIKTLNYAQFAPHELDEVKKRFFREAKAVGKFNHDNIVTIYDTGEEADRAYIAMEYVQGQPLSNRTKKQTLIKSLDEIYWLIESVADALHYAHEKGVVHRDIKPSNILYDEEHGKVKVSDFGIARIVDSSATRTGEIMGSPLYMSPEQVKGETVTGKTDIYSLGVTFYQLLTGELPFTGETIPAITHQIVQGKYTPVTDLNSKIPQSAQKIINKAMHKDPKRRYADAGAMMDDIAKWRDKEF